MAWQAKSESALLLEALSGLLEAESFVNHTHVLDKFVHGASLEREPWWNRRHTDFARAHLYGNSSASYHPPERHALGSNMAKENVKATVDLFCSFCGKAQKEVKKLIAGPAVYICNECIGLCNDIIAEEIDRGGRQANLQRATAPRTEADVESLVRAANKVSDQAVALKAAWARAPSEATAEEKALKIAFHELLAALSELFSALSRAGVLQAPRELGPPVQPDPKQ